MIKIFDNLLSKELQLRIHKSLLSLNYIEEYDRPNEKSTGFASEIDNTSPIYGALTDVLSEIDELKDKELYRSYVNKFLPGEIPFFHTDHNTKESYTALYYSLESKINVDELGETQFYLSELDETKGILPTPGIIIIFNSNILHRATSFRYIDRYTIAFKYR